MRDRAARMPKRLVKAAVMGPLSILAYPPVTALSMPQTMPETAEIAIIGRIMRPNTPNDKKNDLTRSSIIGGQKPHESLCDNYFSSTQRCKITLSILCRFITAALIF
mgnify:CR=1 FL=1